MKKFLSLFVVAVLAIMGFSANAVDYYLIGGFNNWKLADATCKFTQKSAGVYELKLQKQLTSGFKINDGTWANDDVNFGSNGSALVLGEAYTYGTGGSSGNISIAAPVDNPTLTLDVNAGTLLVQGSAGQAVITYAVHGNFAGADDWASTEMTQSGSSWVANNITVTNTAAEFGIKENTNGNQSDWFAAAEATTVSETTTLTLTNSDAKNISLAAGTWSFSFNPSTKSLTITKGGGVTPPPTPTDGDYYLIGGFNNWKLKDPNTAFSKKSEGVYELKYNGQLLSGFKINDGTWDNPEANIGSNGEMLVLGTAYSYGYGDESADIEIAKPVNNPTLTLNVTAGTLLITGAEGEAVISYAIHGNFAGGEDWVSTDMTKSGSNWEVKNVSVTGTDATFGVKELTNGVQTGWYAASEAVVVSGSTTITLTSSSPENISIAAGTYDFSLNPSTKVLTITKSGDTPTPPPTPIEGDYYLVGDYSNDGWKTRTAFTKSGNEYKLQLPTLAGQFKIVGSNDPADWTSQWGTAEAVSLDKQYTLAFDDGQFGGAPNIKFADASASYSNVTITLVPGEENSLLMTITAGGSVVVETKYYIACDEINGWSATGLELMKVGNNTYEATASVQVTEFKVTAVSAAPNWFGAMGDAPVQLSDGVAESLIDGAAAQNMIAPVGAMTFTLTVGSDGAPSTIKVSSSNAINRIAIDLQNGAEYYNMQGVRVLNPTPGMYIVRRGNQVTKELVK